MIAKRVTRTISFMGKLGILVLCLIYTIKTVGVLRRAESPPSDPFGLDDFKVFFGGIFFL